MELKKLTVKNYELAGESSTLARLNSSASASELEMTSAQDFHRAHLNQQSGSGKLPRHIAAKIDHRLPRVGSSLKSGSDALPNPNRRLMA